LTPVLEISLSKLPNTLLGLVGLALRAFDIRGMAAAVSGGFSAAGTLGGAAVSAYVCIVALCFDLIEAPMVIYVVLAGLIATAVEALLKSGLGLRSAQAANLINTLAGGGLTLLPLARSGKI
jgi:uncharacterized membrane protein